MFNSKLAKLGTVLALVAVLALGAVAVVSAQSGDSPINFSHGGRGHGGPGGRDGFGGLLDRDAINEVIAAALGITVDELEAAQAEGTRVEDLAEELGVDIADVEAAVQAARTEAVEAAVAAGDLTQEQADAILSRIESGEGFGPGGHGGPGGRDGFGGLLDRDAINEVIAAALGITVDELDAARAEGTRVEDLAEELGVDIADVEAAVQAAMTEAVEAAVAAGDLTQEQADEILSRIESGEGFGPGGHGRPGGRDGFGGLLDRDAVNEVIAAALGITVDELDDARAEGTRVEDLAEELGVDIADVEAAVQAAMTEAVEAAVEAGDLTQDEADAILSRIESGEGFGPGGHGGPGGRHGRPGGEGFGPRNGDGTDSGTGEGSDTRFPIQPPAGSDA